MTDAVVTQTVTETVTTVEKVPDRIVPAHTEVVHLIFQQYIPSHGSRAGDPHYAVFEAARKRLKAAGKLICWRCGSTTNIQIHHRLVEWCSANGVSFEKFYHRYPELMTECTQEAFENAIESEGGTLPLCQKCHTGKGTGIHYVPEPIWYLGCYWKDGIPPPASPVHVLTIPQALQ
jgi:hypothetical protein